MANLVVQVVNFKAERLDVSFGRIQLNLATACHFEYLVLAFAAQFYAERWSSTVPEDDYERYFPACCRSDH